MPKGRDNIDDFLPAVISESLTVQSSLREIPSVNESVLINMRPDKGQRCIGDCLGLFCLTNMLRYRPRLLNPNSSVLCAPRAGRIEGVRCLDSTPLLILIFHQRSLFPFLFCFFPCFDSARTPHRWTFGLRSCDRQRTMAPGSCQGSRKNPCRFVHILSASVTPETADECLCADPAWRPARSPFPRSFSGNKGLPASSP